ncbi:helix-turn-helix domain-containing protein [Lactococcus petauri]|uniref:helix-turn-helix domain-containing protein n=1 Tax=Lactococcus petauri TaxID=1940789 RepID=UPI0030CC9300
MNLYEKIKELASQKNISIRQLEEKLQLANGTIRRWGKTNPSTGAVTKVADYFNVSVDYLLGRDEAKPVNEPIDLAEVANSDDDDAIWETFLSAGGRPLTDKDKAVIKAVFSDRWEELQQKAKDLKDNEK